jgi:hypothetical protein
MHRPERLSRRTRWITGLAVVVVALLVVVGAMYRGSLGASDPTTPTAIPCYLTGTPAAREQSPILQGCQPVSVGTPIAAGGLTVTLRLSSNQAAPQTVVVDIRDEQGHPVDDATVTLVNRHLEMDHGDFVHKLDHTGSGEYGAKKVGMGMGGRWQTEVIIERPGHPTVSVYFLEILEGLK